MSDLSHIQLTNLTPHQCQLLSRLWATNTAEDLAAWHDELSVEDQALVTTLCCLVTMEYLEADLDQYRDQAQAVIDRVRA
jgi:hypothetical protein